ncbi:MAG: arginase family protein [Micrococcales bacterium]|nr:arginase family protein [Micrococcales bacterium]
MPVRFAVVPQWQGSGSARAMQLVDGAEAIRGDLPSAATTTIEVPLEAGDPEGTGIARASSLRIVRQRFAQALRGVDLPIVTVGGDCSADYAGIARAAAGGPLALVWLDAHPDAHGRDSSPSRAFHGMVARALVDDGVLPESALVFAGCRNPDPAERDWIADRGIPCLTVEDLADPQRLVTAVAAVGAARVYLHIDLDVLDPSEIEGISFPEPFGLSVHALLQVIGALRERFELAGAGLTEFSPSSPAAALEDLPAILRIVGALTRGV